jgi:hypothetical protein
MRELNLEITFILFGILLTLFLIITVPIILYLLFRKKIFKIIVFISLTLGFIGIIIVFGFFTR